MYKYKSKNRKHKAYGNKKLTLMMMTDPTKKGKVVRIPLWIRFPLLGLLVCMGLGLAMLFAKIESLQATIVQQNLEIQTNQYTISKKDYRIDELLVTNDSHFEQLQELKTMYEQSQVKLQNLFEYKADIDEKINSTEKTTDTKPESSLIRRDESDHLELATSDLGIKSGPNVFDEERERQTGDNQLHLSGANQATDKKNVSRGLSSNEDDFDKQLLALNNSMQDTLTALESNIENFEVLEEELDTMIPYWESYPSVFPVKDTYVTSAFGYRRDPLTYVTDFHSGVDLAAYYVPVYATAGGTVIDSTYHRSYGYTVVIDHGFGLKTRYAHNSELLVKEGETVERGEQIAVSGSSGRGTGPHLHYEVLKDGEFQNPLDYIYEGEQ